MKAVIEFNLPADQIEFDQCRRANDMQVSLEDIRQYVDDLYRSDEISEIIRSTILDIIGEL